MTEVNAGTQALAPPAAAMPPRHISAGPGFVDEDEARRVEVELTIEPRFALLQDIGTILLGRVQDEGRMHLDPRCATVAALRLGRRRAVSERQLSPPDPAHCADPEPFGRLSARKSAFNRSNNTVPKITR